MPIHVLTNSGFDVEMGTSIKETNLLYNTDSLNAPTFYFNNGNTGIELEVSVVMKETYWFKERQCSDWLNQWDRWNTVVSVVTDAMDVPNGKYTVKIKNKKQTDKNKSIWKLRLKQFYENDLSFESTFTVKTASLSAIDRILVQYQVIDYYSTTEAILALQRKLQQLGYWSDTVQEFRNGRWYQITESTPDGPVFKKRVPTGRWDDQMQSDIYDFQRDHYMQAKQGKCDRETITDLIGMTRKSSIYDVGA